MKSTPSSTSPVACVVGPIVQELEGAIKERCIADTIRLARALAEVLEAGFMWNDCYPKN